MFFGRDRNEHQAGKGKPELKERRTKSFYERLIEDSSRTGVVKINTEFQIGNKDKFVHNVICFRVDDFSEDFYNKIDEFVKKYKENPDADYSDDFKNLGKRFASLFDVSEKKDTYLTKFYYTFVGRGYGH